MNVRAQDAILLPSGKPIQPDPCRGFFSRIRDEG